MADAITWTYLGALGLVLVVAFRDAPQRLLHARREGRVTGDRGYHVANAASVLVGLAWLVALAGGLDVAWLPEAAWRRTARLSSLYVGWAGFGLALVSRLMLSSAFAPTAAVPPDDRVVQRGPYAHVRHPFYVGMLLGLAAGVVVLDSLATLATLVLLAPLVRVIAAKEEAHLAEELGERYERYRARVPAWFPKP